MTGLFPSITPDNEPFVDSQYRREELEDMDWAEIRSIAAQHPSEEINGQSDREAMEAFLVGEERIKL